jgi:hypothetical protein
LMSKKTSKLNSGPPLGEVAMPPLEDKRASNDLAPAVVPAAIPPVPLPAARVTGARLAAPLRQRNRRGVPEVRSDRRAAELGGGEQRRSPAAKKFSGQQKWADRQNAVSPFDEGAAPRSECPTTRYSLLASSGEIERYFVRPLAVNGSKVGACYNFGCRTIIALWLYNRRPCGPSLESQIL